METGILEVDLIFEDLNERLGKTVESYKNELISIRAGRANAHILDKIVVDYYGTPTPIKQLANITIPEARLLVISVWDASALKTVERAIIAANVGIMPNNDGKVLRMVFPELTEERRKALCKDIKTQAENSKVALRNIRRDAMDMLKKYKKDSVITEDDFTIYEKEVDKELSKNIELIDKMLADKDKEILTV